MLSNSITLNAIPAVVKTNTRYFRHLLPLIILALVSCFVMQDFLFNKATFIGAIDRFGNFLNIRKFQIDSIHNLGAIPVWNDNMFMGYSIAATHWMAPNFDIFAWLQSLAPGKYFFTVTTYTSCILQILTAWSAYAFINYVLQDRLAAIVGAILYVCSEIVTMFTAQGDNNVLIFWLLPLGLLCLRKLFYQYHIKYLIGFSLLAIALPTTAVLQLAAYVFLVFGCYALFLTITTRNWRMLLLISMCFAVAIILAVPRMYTILLEIKTIERPDWGYFCNSMELLRWIYDGIMGRFPSELPGTFRYSMHDGMQLFTAVPAFFSLLLLGAIIFAKGKYGKLLLPCFIIAVADIFWMIGIKNGQMQYYFLAVVVVTAIITGWAMFNRRTQNVQLNIDVDFKELLFFACILFACVAVIFLPAARNLLWLLFLKVDFVHSRISVVAVLFYALLTAYFIKSIFGVPNRQKWHYTRVFLLLAAIITAAVIIQAANYVWSLEVVAKLQRSWFLISYQAALYVAVLFTVFMIFMLIVSANKSATYIRYFLCAVLASLMAWDAMYYAKLQFAGKQTRSNVPFAWDELYNAAPGKFNPPSNAQVAALQQLLENNNYRSALIGNNHDFAGFYGSFLSQFWRLRLIEGYGAGVPKRLTRLPWPDGVNDVRQLRFTSWNVIPWDILAMLNVKNVLYLNEALYFNNFSKSDSFTELEIRDNPYAVIPRAFFAKSITPMQLDLQAHRVIELPQPTLTTLNATDVVISWDKGNNYNYDLRKFIVQRKALPAGEYQSIYRSPQNNYTDKDLEPGTYCYRLKGSSFNLHAKYLRDASAEQCISIPATTLPTLQLPKNVAITALDPHHIAVTWQHVLPHLEYAIAVNYAGATFTQRTTPGATKDIIHLPAASKGFITINACFNGQCTHSTTKIAFNTHLATKQYPKNNLQLASGAVIAANPIAVSSVEGIAAPQEFNIAGDINANFNNDSIEIAVTPAADPRFLVLNEMFHHTWKAYAAGKELQIYPVNLAMRGVFVPPNVTNIYFKNEPFLFSKTGKLVLFLGIVLWGLVLLVAPLFLVPKALGAAVGRRQ